MSFHLPLPKLLLHILTSSFSCRGIPDVVKTDNGPPFNGNEFQTFSKDCGFHHHQMRRLWPDANGEAERFMATLSKYVRAATAENSNRKNQLPQFLSITELQHIARSMSLLLKPSQAERCESASLNDPFYTLIPLHLYIRERCRMTRSASRRWSTLQTRSVTASLQISTLVIMHWSNNPRPVS